jgi:hypothetical protein
MLVNKNWFNDPTIGCSSPFNLVGVDWDKFWIKKIENAFE